jgi:hypothetical protein
VLDGAAEAPAVLDAIKKAGASVIVHPTMARHGGEMENASFESSRASTAASARWSRARTATWLSSTAIPSSTRRAAPAS